MRRGLGARGGRGGDGKVASVSSSDKGSNKLINVSVCRAGLTSYSLVVYFKTDLHG